MFIFRFAPVLSAGMLALCLAASAKADSLTGTTIAQTAASIGNTTLNASSASASVGAGFEFTNVLHLNAGPDLDIYQDFSDAGLTISFATAGSSLYISNGTTTPTLSFTYTDSAFSGLYSFQGGLCTANSTCLPISSSNYTTSFSGSTLKVDIFSLSSSQSVTFGPSAPVATTPEPDSLALTLTGLLSAAGMVRRRFSGARNENSL